MIEKKDKSERRAETELQENGNCFVVWHLFLYLCTARLFNLVLFIMNWSEDTVWQLKHFFVFFLLMCRLDQHHHPVTRLRRRRKRRNKTGPTRHLMKRRGERRRKRSWKATKRRARSTKRSMGKVRRRSRRRGNKNHLPPRPPAPVNPQTVTETHLWRRTQGIP